MDSSVRIDVRLDAIRENLELAKGLAQSAKVMAVVKADAYGHGLANILPALAGAHALAVATVGEGLSLRRIGYDGVIYVLSRIVTAEDVDRALDAALGLVLHTEEQVGWYIETHRRLDRSPGTSPGDSLAYPNVWLKYDSGMHRLGLCQVGYYRAIERLKDANIANIGVLSHFACADQPGDPANAAQLENFEAVTARHVGPRSMANSAALIGLGEAAKFDWVRPGIMLYGSSPLIGKSATELGLRPAMRLCARLIATREHAAGQAVGYGGTWKAEESTTLGVVALGYADGYPRGISSATPVAIRGRRYSIVGRVSMDMLIVDLGKSTTAAVGDFVELFGDEVSIDEIAASASTISYELLVRLSTRAAVSKG